MSPRLARGLRRDLFRDLADRLDARWVPFQRCLAAVVLPYRGPGEHLRVWERTMAQMERTTFSFRERIHGHLFATGVCLLPSVLRHDDGGDEALLQATDITLKVQGGRVSRTDTALGSFSQHLVERIFERMNTTRPSEVMRELEGLLFWMRLLHTASRIPAVNRHLVQMVLPGASGTALCIRDPDNGRIAARTWLATGSSSRVDATVQALQAWKAQRTGSAEALEAVLRQPENLWLREPYSG